MLPAKKYEKFKVLGYVRPADTFYTLAEWENLVLQLIKLQFRGLDTRSGKISCKHASFCSTEDFENFIQLITQYWGYQLDVETERYDLLTRKNVLDFIEDFVNHRFWGFKQEFGHYFPDINRLKFAYFYSRGDMEPYVMLDEEYTTQLYNSLEVIKPVYHFVSFEGLKRLEKAISHGEQFDISSYTQAERPFFRETSVLRAQVLGQVRGAFRSDIKSLALDNGRRACNMYRLQYPGHDVSNICVDLTTCDDEEIRTGLWNEYIVTPLRILKVEEIS